MNELADGRVGGFLKDVRGYFIYLTPRNLAAAVPLRAHLRCRGEVEELSVESGSPGLAPDSASAVCVCRSAFAAFFFFLRRTCDDNSFMKSKLPDGALTCGTNHFCLPKKL